MGVFLSADQITSTYLLLEANKNNNSTALCSFPVLLYFWYLELLYEESFNSGATVL